MIHSEVILLMLAETEQPPYVPSPNNNAINLITIVYNGIYSLLTLYIMAMLLCWLSPFLSLNLRRGPYIWLHRITDPAFKGMRRILPNVGPFDAAPIACIMAVWLIRMVLTGQ